MDYFVIVSMMFIIGVPLLMLLLANNKAGKVVISRNSNESDQYLENLNRIQRYEFWRDFGKQETKK